MEACNSRYLEKEIVAGSILFICAGNTGRAQMNNRFIPRCFPKSKAYIACLLLAAAFESYSFPKSYP